MTGPSGAAGAPSPDGAAPAPASPLSRGALLLSVGLLAASVVIGVLALVKVGPTATVPIHWNASGQADGWGPAWLSLLLTPAIQVGLLVLLAFIPRFEPRRLNLSRSGRAYSVIVVAVMALTTVIQLGLAIATLGVTFEMALIVLAGVGVLFIAIGIVMPGFQPNYMAGIRTPWTLTSDLSWRKTHVVGGRVFVLVGAGMVYSYRVWKRDPDKRTT